MFPVCCMIKYPFAYLFCHVQLLIYSPATCFYHRNRGERRMNAFECMRRVYQTEGWRGFYRGMSASYAGISETVIHFVIYESIKRKLMESKAQASMDQDEDESVKDASDFVGMMLAAATSKTCATSIAYPHGMHLHRQFLLIM